MPKSFLFTHKRYDYEGYTAATKVKLENETEGEDNVLQNRKCNPRNPEILSNRNSVSASSVSSDDYSDNESLSPLPMAGFMKSHLNLNNLTHVTQSELVHAKPLTKNKEIGEHKHKHELPFFPKKILGTCQSEPSLEIHHQTSDLETEREKDFRPTSTLSGTPLPEMLNQEDLQFKEEGSVIPFVVTSSLQGFRVSPSPSMTAVTVDKHEGIKTQNDFLRRGNVIQLYRHRQQRPCSTSNSSMQSKLHSCSSYQIKLESPPPGGTLTDSNRCGFQGIKEEGFKVETMIPSPLQFIIAAVEQQEQTEEERVFIKGSRSGDNHKYYTCGRQGPNNVDLATHSHHPYAQQEQPVNLSVKKVDLFNLTQLAEVSIEAAKREMLNGRSSNNAFSSITTDYPAEVNGNHLNDEYSSQSATKGPNPLKQPPCSTGRPADDDSLPLMSIGLSKNILRKPGGTGHTKLAKTDSTRRHIEIAVGSKENGRKLIGKVPTPNFSSSLPQRDLRSDKNLGAILSLSNCTITGNNACTSVSSSTSSATTASQRHKCVECGKGFSTLSNLARHRQTHRSLSDASAVKKCPHCDKVYVSMPAFSMHLRTHNQGCKCPYCGKGFSRPWLLQGHIRTHTGEKPFKCGICSKAFADKSNLRAHTQTHSTEKPFACQRCGKLFALKSYLCKHIESSCMKSNRPSGSGGNSASGTGSNSFTSTTATARKTEKQHHHHQGSINNSPSASSPVSSSCSTRDTSPSLMPTSTLSSSPTHRDIRSAIVSATTVTAYSNITSTSSSLSNLSESINETISFAAPTK